MAEWVSRSGRLLCQPVEYKIGKSFHGAIRGDLVKLLNKLDDC